MMLDQWMSGSQSFDPPRRRSTLMRAIFDIDKWVLLFRGLFSTKMLLIPLIAVGGYMIHTHRQISSDLQLAALEASSDLGHYFLNYRAAQSFRPEEILELMQAELVDEALQLREEGGPEVFLQAIHWDSAVVFDTREPEILELAEGDLPVVRSKASFGTWKDRETYLYVDQGMLNDETWTLRTALSFSSYFKVQSWKATRFLVVITIFWLIGQFASRQYEEAIRSRRFDHLVRTVLRLSREDEKALIQSLPGFTCRLLKFDAAAVYLAEGNRIVPKAYELKRGTKPDREFLSSTDVIEITLDSDFPEAKVFRQERGRIQEVDPHPEKGKITNRPYIISPVFSQREKKVIGLLTAEREDRPDGKDLQKLNDLALLVAVLIDDVRNTQKIARSHRQMVRMTRQVTLGTVVPVVAHNMRSPLTMIPLLVKDLSEKWRRLDSERIEEDLQTIKFQAEQCLDLIQRILDYQNMGKDSGSSEDLSPARPMDPVKILSTSCGFFKSYLEIKNIALEVEIEDGLHSLVEMDELDFHQVITNLIINADQAFPEEERSHKGYKIKVSMTVDSKTGNIQLRIKDNGPGVKPEDRNRIFNESFTTKGEDGTGVGLPYCKRVIEDAKGKIHLEASTSAGASFLITLPTVTE